ncbi:hypothetical protein B0F90DRAFT_218777 [Multifurca ochricompacta]|uniref:Uncharacterized protein n=1 Tax=Multifurca ochricompacta TaxID=376703 RepID=A0AAD4QPE5_9AGAM|nr:hypothetical protein B0F90DRAFT_218777 [Multifurca ochricompacta]
MQIPLPAHGQPTPVFSMYTTNKPPPPLTCTVFRTRAFAHLTQSTCPSFLNFGLRSIILTTSEKTYAGTINVRSIRSCIVCLDLLSHTDQMKGPLPTRAYFSVLYLYLYIYIVSVLYPRREVSAEAVIQFHSHSSSQRLTNYRCDYISRSPNFGTHLALLSNNLRCANLLSVFMSPVMLLYPVSFSFQQSRMEA